MSLIRRLSPRLSSKCAKIGQLYQWQLRLRLRDLDNQFGVDDSPGAPKQRRPMPIVRNGKSGAARKAKLAPAQERREVRLPVAVHAEASLQFLELIGVALAGGVDVLGFCDESHVVAAGDALVAEDFFVGTQVFAVDD